MPENFVDCLKRHNEEVIIDENRFAEFYVHGGSVSMDKPSGIL
jgi:hypothetical protein